MIYLINHKAYLSYCHEFLELIGKAYSFILLTISPNAEEYSRPTMHISFILNMN